MNPMKKLIVMFGFVLMSFLAFSQEITKAEYNDMSVIVFQRIDSIDKSKDLLFSMTKEWFVNTFKSGKAVIELEDKEKGTIIGKGYSEYNVTKYNIPIQYHYTVKAEMKDNKVRLTIYDIYTKGSGLNGIEKPAEFWFGPLCKKCSKDISEQHQGNIIMLSEMLRYNYFKAMKQGIDSDW